jgi:hypothetical protein
VITAVIGRDKQPALVLLGLSAGNLERLSAGEPILIDEDKCRMLGLRKVELVIFTGEDEVGMTREFEDHGIVPPGTTERAKREVDATRRQGNGA